MACIYVTNINGQKYSSIKSHKTRCDIWGTKNTVCCLLVFSISMRQNMNKYGNDPENISMIAVEIGSLLCVPKFIYKVLEWIPRSHLILNHSGRLINWDDQVDLSSGRLYKSIPQQNSLCINLLYSDAVFIYRALHSTSRSLNMVN